MATTHYPTNSYYSTNSTNPISTRNSQTTNVILESLNQFFVNPIHDYLVGVSGEPHVSSFKEPGAFRTAVFNQQIIVFNWKGCHFPL